MPKFKVGDVVHEENMVYEVIGYSQDPVFEDYYEVQIIVGNEIWRAGETGFFPFSSTDKYDYHYSHLAREQFDKELEALLEE